MYVGKSKNLSTFEVTVRKIYKKRTDKQIKTQYGMLSKANICILCSSIDDGESTTFIVELGII